MPDSPQSSPTFAAVAQRVMLRVWLRRWLALLGRTVWLVTALVALPAILGLAWQASLPSMLIWLVLLAWLVATAAVMWRSRPGPFSALAFWDQVKGRREAFAAAWWFEQQGTPLTEAEQRHVETQRSAMAEALPALNRDLPLRPHRWLWLPPTLALLVSILTIALPDHGDTLLVDEAMKQKALEEANKLAQTDWNKKKLEGLKAEEQKALDQLKENLKQTAQNLEQAGGKDAREVMSDLERRAREAEKLAERLGSDKDAWASDKLTKALREHADTADLGDALAAKNANQAATAAEALAKGLKAPQLTHDARERMNETLKDAQKDAEKEDRKRMAGQHVLNAGDRLQQTQPVEAGAEFEKLADKMRDLARREQTRKELEKLAEQLRDAGSNIAGQNQAGGMQQMAAAGQQGQGNSSGQAPQVGQAQAGLPGQSQPQQQQLQPPGLGQMSPGQQPPMMMNPVPGTGQQPQQPLMMAQGQPGQQGKGQPMLMAPIPGAKPGEQPSAFMLGPPGQKPGDGPMIAIATPGGKEAGVGKAELNADPTAKQNTANQAVVAPQQSNEGQSTVRAIEGGTRQEQASRTASQMAVDFIQAEEEALDESALPPSRREQVRRYFTELRKRFEKTP
ncbi:MAG: hypothetical protein U0984_08780 [Prosthecobacter sp.]|nr:hypothetical protein [Prosthecobacter sp.]